MAPTPNLQNPEVTSMATSDDPQVLYLLLRSLRAAYPRRDYDMWDLRVPGTPQLRTFHRYAVVRHV